MMIRHPQRRQRGFTILEAIAVIIITGIVGAFVTVFIQIPVRTYLTTVARAEASDLSDNTMRRLTRDLRLALPNSVRVTSPTPTTRYIEFLQTSAGLRYLAEDDVIGAAAPGNYLNWNDATKKSFDVVGAMPTGSHAPAVGNYVVVYNLGADQEPGNAYNCDGGVVCNRAVISALAGNTITLAANPFPAQMAAGTPLMSPNKRLHVVTSPVT